MNIDKLINNRIENAYTDDRKSSGAGSGSATINFGGMQQEINNLRMQYEVISQMAASPEGMVMPDASSITNEDIANKEMDMLERMNNSEAMLLAGRYSMLKTGDANAFFKAMEYKSKTMDDLSSLKMNMKTVSSPTASYSARMASSAALQREFGINATEDYKHINTAVLGLKQLQSGFAEKLLGSAKGLQQTLIKASPVTPGRNKVNFSQYPKLLEIYNMLQLAAEEKPDSETTSRMAIPLLQLGEMVSDPQKHFVTTREKTNQR